MMNQFRRILNHICNIEKNNLKYYYRRHSIRNYQIVKPGNVSSENPVPPEIAKPDYYDTYMFTYPPKEPEIKSNGQISHMYASCRLAKYILNSVEKYIQSGQTTDEIDLFVHDLIIKNSAYPSPLRYRGFPKSVCTSVNNVVCHGIPDDRCLVDGDIINVDVSVYFNGYHGDCSATFCIGEVDKDCQYLVQTTKKCLDEAVKICRPGEYFQTIGYVIEETARKDGYNVIPAFIGHGIGSYFHGPPDIYHVCNDYPGKMDAGMTFTIEPILTLGSEDIVILEDGWTAVSIDSMCSAQFEHTVLITHDGVEVLTE